MINKPKLNREEALCADRIRRKTRQRFEQICSLLKDEEHLAEPFREADRIVIQLSSNRQLAAANQVIAPSETTASPTPIKTRQNP